MAEKIKIDYDEEFDDLLIYRKDKKADFTVNLGDFVIDALSDGSIASIEILQATDTLSKLLNTKITKNDIIDAKDAVIVVNTRENALYIYLSLKSKKEIKFPIVMPAIHA